MVEGITSRSPLLAASASTRRISSIGIRRGGLAAARRWICSVLCGLCSSHITQWRLQSSGLVSNVILHGPRSGSTRDDRRRSITSA